MEGKPGHIQHELDVKHHDNVQNFVSQNSKTNGREYLIQQNLKFHMIIFNNIKVFL